MAINHDKLKKRHAGRAGQGWRPRDGENRIRILPPGSRYLTAWETMEDLCVTFKMHYFRSEGRQTEVSRCLQELGQKCPACAVWGRWRKASDPALAQLAKDVGPAEQYLFNIIDLANPQAGVQVWGSNYTCWDGIMDIAANPQWGNVVDPADGVNFIIGLTLAARSRTGFNSYSVQPEPQRTSVLEVLAQFPNWQESLDTLESHFAEAKTGEEIAALLREMGFPEDGGGGGGVAAKTPPPVMAPPAPVAPPPMPPPIVPPVAPVSTAPAPAVVVTPPAPAIPVTAPTPAAPAAGVAAATVATPPATATTEVHYDPGEGYTEPLPVSERPRGAPRCFGDFDPERHQCQPCLHMVACQLRMLTVE